MPEQAFEAPDPSPLFGDHDYEIAYAPRGSSFEVRLRGRLSTPPRVGDAFTLARDDIIHDLVVTEVRLSDTHGWSARCSLPEQS
jgi:hypothetical protein